MKGNISTATRKKHLRSGGTQNNQKALFPDGEKRGWFLFQSLKLYAALMLDWICKLESVLGTSHIQAI